MKNIYRSSAASASIFSFWAFVLFLFSGVIPSALAENVDEGFVRQVRTIDLENVNISNPAGMAYSPTDNKLLVVEAAQRSRSSDGTTEVKAISLTEDKMFSKDLSVNISNPANIAFDSKSRTLQAFDSKKNRLVRFKEKSSGELDEKFTDSVSIEESEVPKNFRSMAVDPLKNRMFFLDSNKRRIVVTNSDGDSMGAIDLSNTGQTDFKGIAFNPHDKHLYALSPASQQLFEVTDDGTVENAFDVSAFNLSNPQSMVFAPSGDQTDDPSTTHLYIADSDNPIAFELQSQGPEPSTEPSSGQIMEVSFTPVPEIQAQASSCFATLIRETDTSLYNPSSPDPSGVTYEAASGRLVIVDGEVDEIAALFTGDNVFETDLDGSLLFPSTTLNFTSEPTGATLDPNTGHLFFTDDNNARIFELRRNISNSAIDFDVVRQFSTLGFPTSDPEGITFADLPGGQQALFIAGGLDNEIYRIDPGPNGIFDGIDDIVTSFDTLSRGVNDPEGIVYNDNGFLYVIGKNSSLLTEFDLSGNVIRTCDISAVAGTGGQVNLAGLAMAPGSRNPGDFNLYIVDRGVDNNPNPNENDGRLLEAFIPSTGNVRPTANAGPDQVVTLPTNASLNGSATDDGLPAPPALTFTWTQRSGPGSATILSPNAANTEVSFSTEGTYIFRLTVNDSVLSDFDEVAVTVVPKATQTATLSSPISLGSDDAEERLDGTVILGSDLDLVRSRDNQTIGLRFNRLAIPQGARIIDAYIQFTAKDSESEVTSLTLAGEATNNARSFTRTRGGISARPKTTAAVSWSLATWKAEGDADLAQRTPDLTPIIQEIISRAGWVSNNSLAIIITGTGKREADSFETNPEGRPVLHIEFSGAAGNQPPTVSITGPVNGENFAMGESIRFTGKGNDAEDGDVGASLIWRSNLDGEIGSGRGFVTTTLSKGSHTITATATDSDSASGSDSITVIVASSPSGGQTTTVSIPISSGSDDAEERSDGVVILRSDLDIVRSGGNQTIGLRFNGVKIPRDATIVDAYIQFTANKAISEATSLTLEGEATNHAATFSNRVNGNISARSRTTARVSWSPADWKAVGDAGLDQRTPGLSAIIQEIVNRIGWVNKNSLAILITGTGKREAQSFEIDSSAAPVLHVEFE